MPGPPAESNGPVAAMAQRATSKQWAAASVLLVVVSLAVSGVLYRENRNFRRDSPLRRSDDAVPAHHHGAR